MQNGQNPNSGPQDSRRGPGALGASLYRLPPLTPEQVQGLIHEQRDFERRFPPLRHRNDDILIVSWSEIERQFLDLCAPWDRSDQAIMIRVAQQTSAHESAEKTLRALFVLNHMRTSIDTPMPRRTGVASLVR